MNLQLKEEIQIWPPVRRKNDNPDTMAQVKHCVKWLESQDFTVVYVQPSARNPRVHVKASPLCGQLDGAVRMCERGTRGEIRYWVAIRFNCEVRWMERDAESEVGK